MSNVVLNPYSYAVQGLDRCWEGGTEVEGIAFNQQSTYNRFGAGQRILTGSEYIGETLTIASFVISLYAGKSPAGNLECRVIANSGSGGASGTTIGYVDMTTLTTSMTKTNFTGTGTRVLQANDCIFLLMPLGSSTNGYEVGLLQDTNSFIDYQDSCYVQSDFESFYFQNNDCNWCFNVS